MTSDAGPFPESPRVIYGKNPLEQVICQLRFPAVLRIEAEPPAAFQERIRKEYPVLREGGAGNAVELPPSMPEVVQNLVRSTLSSRQKGKIAYDFVATDEKWAVGLTREFLSLSSTHYTRWEEFKSHLDGPLRALIEVYSPAFFSRIGLRYQDVIKRSQLGLQDRAWSDLIRPHVAGMLASPDLLGTVAGISTQAIIEFPNKAGQVGIRHGLAQQSDTREDCYLIDSDFSTQQKTGVDDARDILDYFNRQSGRLFRWCITDTLHRAMEPRNIGP